MNLVKTKTLLREVDLGAVQLCLEVVGISSEENERAGEESDEDTCRDVLGSRARDNGAILAHDLDALHEVAAVVVGVLDVQPVLALSGLLIELLARLLDLVPVGLVILVILIGVRRLLARHALGSDHGRFAVGQSLAVGESRVSLATAVLVGELGACVISEDSEEDAATVLGA